MQGLDDLDISRRQLLILGAVSAAAAAAPLVARAQAPVTEPSVTSKVSFEVNGTIYTLDLDTRTTLLMRCVSTCISRAPRKAAITANAVRAR